MDSRNKTQSDKTDESDDDRGQTFWILVYVFMAFAIFEVLCIVLFLVYRFRRKRKGKRKESENIPSATTSYDNRGMQEATTTSSQPENVELYESGEPRYSSIKHIHETIHSAPIDNLQVIENGFQANVLIANSRSRSNSRISQASCPIFVLPKDCVIVHAPGSRKSRVSSHSRQQSATSPRVPKWNDVACVVNEAGPKASDDNRSLHSWASFSSEERTSTDEDYVSGSIPANWDEDSLYEEPDKVIRFSKSPQRSYCLEKLFEIQERIENEGDADAHEIYVNEKDMATRNDDVRRPNACVDNGSESLTDNEEEHIYELPEGLAREYYENAYDLPEDALAKCLGKPNRFALRHVLHVDESGSRQDEASLNLGMEFVNNSETIVEGEDVKLRPTRKSTLFLQESERKSDRTFSNC